MSLILEALKKSEQARQQKAGPDGAAAAPETDVQAGARRRWLRVAMLAALPLLAFAIGGGVGFFRLVPVPAPAAKAARPPAPPTEPTAARKAPAETPAAAPAAEPAKPASPTVPAAAAPDKPDSPPEAKAAQPPAATVAATPPPVEAPAAAPGPLTAVAVPKKPAPPFAARALPPGSAEALALARRASGYEENGVYDQAIAVYSQAIELDPGLADAYLGRGWSRLATGAPGEAARDFQRLTALRPDRADAYFGHAWALEQMGDRAQASRQYGEAIRLQPDHADAYFSRGVLEFMAGRMVEAARDFAAVRERTTGQLQDYALLWRHVSQARGGAAAPMAALGGRRASEPWPGILVKLFRGEATADQVLAAARHRDAAKQRENECIALFFLGQQRLIAGDAKGAAEYFRRTLATGVTYFRQYGVAGAELARLETITGGAPTAPGR